MKRRVSWVYALCLLLCSFNPIAVQARSLNSLYSLGEYVHGNNVIEARNGDLIVAGSNQEKSGKNGLFLMRLDSSGKVFWRKEVEGAKINIKCLAEDSKGNIFLGLGSQTDGSIVKYNSEGKVSWSKPITWFPTRGIGVNQSDELLAVSNSEIVKFSGEGNQIWEPWGPRKRTLRGIEVLANNGFVVWGKTNNIAFVSRYDASPKELWKWTLPKSSEVISLSVRGDGGFTALVALGSKPHLKYISPDGKNGETVKIPTVSDAPCPGCKHYFRPAQVIAASDGGSLVVGTRYLASHGLRPAPADSNHRQAFLQKFDQRGALIWERAYGVNARGFTGTLTKNGLFLVAGQYFNFNHGNRKWDLWLFTANRR